MTLHKARGRPAPQDGLAKTTALRQKIPHGAVAAANVELSGEPGLRR